MMTSTSQGSRISRFRPGRSINREMSSSMSLILARKRYQSIGTGFLESVMRKLLLAVALLEKEVLAAPAKAQTASSGIWTVVDTRNPSNQSQIEASPRTPLIVRSTCLRSSQASPTCSRLTAQTRSQQAWAGYQGLPANLSVRMTSDCSRILSLHPRTKPADL